MRKIVTLILFCSFLVGCNDGDLAIEQVNFDDAAIQSCETINDNTSILFKIKDSEALVLTLASGLIVNETTEAGAPRTSTIDENSQLLYRIFSENVAKDYFCDAIPPTTPTVLEEIPAVNGIVSVTTTSTVDGNTTTYEHTITLSEVSMINNQGERITDLTEVLFGTVTTVAEN
jgi:hypothetical protein